MTSKNTILSTPYYDLSRASIEEIIPYINNFDEVRLCMPQTYHYFTLEDSVAKVIKFARQTDDTYIPLVNSEGYFLGSVDRNELLLAHEQLTPKLLKVIPLESQILSVLCDRLNLSRNMIFLDTLIISAAKMLAEQDLSPLPVINFEQQLVGTISAPDIRSYLTFQE